MRIDAFAHALPPRYRARVLELLEARGAETAVYEGNARRVLRLG